METKLPILFLGGTCNNSTWRDELIPLLDQNKIDYYNPVVKDWTIEHILMENEIKSRHDCVELYVITKDMTGVYSIAEVVDASNKKPKRSIFMIIPDGISDANMRSLIAVGKLIKKNGSHIAGTYKDIIDYVKSLSTFSNP